jgi:hypothetical protein
LIKINATQGILTTLHYLKHCRTLREPVQETVMGALDQAREHALAERLRQLKSKLGTATDRSEREGILRQIREIEEDVSGKLKEKFER